MRNNDEIRFRITYPYTSKMDKQDANDHSAAVVGQTTAPQDSQ